MLPWNDMIESMSEKSSWLLITMVSTATSSLKLTINTYSEFSLQSGNIRYSSWFVVRIALGLVIPLPDFERMVAPESFDAKFFLSLKLAGGGECYCSATVLLLLTPSNSRFKVMSNTCLHKFIRYLKIRKTLSRRVSMALPEGGSRVNSNWIGGC